MDLIELKEIIAIFEQAEITELDLERDGVRVRLKKAGPAEPVRIAVNGDGSPQLGVPAALRQESQPEEGMVQVEAPMVGTFYRAPAPDAETYVEEGDEVSEGQVICIIEAMKLMNEIKAEVSGRVVKILVETGQPVEFGQPMFLVQQG